MTTTLLLRLAGPMQSWGTQSRFRDRDTGREPSKSGVIGLLCAALGRPREAPVDDLAALRMGVRVENPGVVQRDYQTAGGTHLKGARYGVAHTDGSPGKFAAISSRAYLADASFLVGLEAATPDQVALLRTVDAALAAPVWPLFLGRKSYTPGAPVRLPDAPPAGPGLHEITVEAALTDHPWYDEYAPTTTTSARLVIECAPDDPNAEARNDWPLSFVSADRRFATRYVTTRFVNRPAPTTSGSAPTAETSPSSAPSPFGPDAASDGGFKMDGR